MSTSGNGSIKVKDLLGIIGELSNQEAFLIGLNSLKIVVARRQGVEEGNIFGGSFGNGGGFRKIGPTH